MDISSLLLLLIVLFVLSAFFSGSEIGMMSINRYRLRHQVRKGHAKAKRVAELLSRPDRLLGIILIGNTFVNILATSVATVVCVHYLGREWGVFIATVGLTLAILILAETAPKTLAAIHPERFAYFASLPLRVLLRVLYPLVWLVNAAANGVLKLFRVQVKHRALEPLNAEELRTLVHEASGKISTNYQQMLLRILDLEQVKIDHVMIPRNEIDGIDLNDSWETVIKQLSHTDHAYLPVYRDNIDQVQGMLNSRRLLSLLHSDKKITETDIVALMEKIYFIPEGAMLNQQLLNFQEQQKSIGLVVDEYGDIQGLVRLQDILEEIVGEFSLDMQDPAKLVKPQKDGSVIVSGTMNMRELNRTLKLELPTDGPKTLSGLIIEYLEVIPKNTVGLRIAGYALEIVDVGTNTIQRVRIWPEKYRKI